ncbi:unnamed protein product, partial [Symbiodinium necroappetens]
AMMDVQRWPSRAMEILGFGAGQPAASILATTPTSHFPAPLMRHVPSGDVPSLIWLGELAAVLITLGFVLVAVHLQVSECLGQRRKMAEKAERLAHPWSSLPISDLLQVGPSFATNFQSGLRQAFTDRGLSPVEPDQVALASFLIPAEAAGTRQPRAVLERHGGVPPGSLGGKRALALHLQRLKREALAPMTFLSPDALRKSLEPRVRFAGIVQGVVSEARADGLWFLKHSTMDRNEGVTCYKGARELLRAWEKMKRKERGRYVAQAEVQRPLLMEGRKMVVRAYVITLPGGRCFMNRELLLKGHPMSYDPTDPDPLRHVVSCVKYDGVVSMRGTGWTHYEKVWPKLAKMMTTVLSHVEGAGKVPFALPDDTLLDLFCHRVVQKYQDLLDWMRWGSKAGALLYNFMGADIIVDEDLRPWLLELNPGPAMGFDQRDPQATQLRAEVMEDLCQFLLDPLLRSVQAAAKTKVELRPPHVCRKALGKSHCHRRSMSLRTPKARRPNATHKVTRPIKCMACPNFEAPDREAYRLHCATEWHKYNTSQRMMGRPTLTEEEYNEKFAPAPAAAEPPAEKDSAPEPSQAEQEEAQKVSVCIVFHHKEERWSHIFKISQGASVMDLKKAMVKPDSPEDDVLSFSLKRGMIRPSHFETLENDDTFDFAYVGPEAESMEDAARAPFMLEESEAPRGRSEALAELRRSLDRLAAKMNVEQRAPTMSASAETYVRPCVNGTEATPRADGVISRPCVPEDCDQGDMEAGMDCHWTGGYKAHCQRICRRGLRASPAGSFADASQNPISCSDVFTGRARDHMEVVSTSLEWTASSSDFAIVDLWGGGGGGTGTMVKTQQGRGINVRRAGSGSSGYMQNIPAWQRDFDPTGLYFPDADSAGNARFARWDDLYHLSYKQDCQCWKFALNADYFSSTMEARLAEAADEVPLGDRTWSFLIQNGEQSDKLSLESFDSSYGICGGSGGAGAHVRALVEVKGGHTYRIEAGRGGRGSSGRGGAADGQSSRMLEKGRSGEWRVLAEAGGSSGAGSFDGSLKFFGWSWRDSSQIACTHFCRSWTTRKALQVQPPVRPPDLGHV